MADNYLEKHREDYERRKMLYLNKKKSHLPKSLQKNRENPMPSEQTDINNENINK